MLQIILLAAHNLQVLTRRQAEGAFRGLKVMSQDEHHDIIWRFGRCRKATRLPAGAVLAGCVNLSVLMTARDAVAQKD